MSSKEVVRVAAVGDLHYGKNSQGSLAPLFSEVAKIADVLVLCGDLTDLGMPEEAHLLARDLSVLKLPIVAVLGNHDYESGHEDEVTKILCDAGVIMLDGEAVEIEGVGFAGIKGFGGGFGRGTLSPFGEAGMKAFVQEAANEVIKLEKALARLRTRQRVAVLHYAPIRETVEGEPVEIFPFLGTGRLEEPLNRYRATAVVHGHAHRGAPEGRTSTGVPVYNVALPLMQRLNPNQPAVRMLELSVLEAKEAASPAS